MEDTDEYITEAAYSFGNEAEIIKQAREELLEDEVEVESTIGADVPEQESVDVNPESDVTGQFEQTVSKQEDVQTGSENILDRGYQVDEVNLEDNEGIERIESATSIEQKHSQILEANEQFREKGISRRYVLTESDAPDTAFTFKDALSTYYYEVDKPLTPEDCVEKLDIVDSWFDVNKEDRPAIGILALAEEYPWAFEDFLESDVDKSALLENVFVSELDMTTEKRDVHKEFSKYEMEKMRDMLNR